MPSSEPADPDGAGAAVPTPVAPGPARVGGLDIEVVVVPERRGVRLTVERDARITVTVPAGFDTARLGPVSK
jgi:hypothetical protein